MLLACAMAGLRGQDRDEEKPKYCILFIGDGFGVSAKTAARMAMGQGTIGKRFSNDPGFKVLALDKLRFNAMVTTHSANSWITDSGPGAAVYAAGEKGKTDNESISFDVKENTPVETILEAAKKEGYAVGLITTTRITHATPAAFASHTWFRDLEDYIAAQYISSTQNEYKAIYNDPASSTKPYNPSRDWQLPDPKIGAEVDVLLGGGFRHFFPKGAADTIKDKDGNPILNKGSVIKLAGKRIDNVNLIKYAEQRGYEYLNSRDALLNIDETQFSPDNNKKLLGLFHNSHMNYEQDRQMSAPWEPSLFEMMEAAVKVLKAKGGKKGFFLMVEGGRIDHLEHANEGGITVVSGIGGNQFTVDSDKPVYTGGGDGTYDATPSTGRVPGVYGSDYLVKEVLAFDYAVAVGRKLLDEKDSKTLIFSTSDHECGGTAIVGLHDAQDAQNNGTLVRTYALGPRQNNVSASSNGGPTATTFLTPVNIQRGDIDYGTTNANGWYPNYSTYTFQGRPELWPSVNPDGRRIVVAFASNPLTNGNSTKAGGTPGNHTPMDIWVGADDNADGKYASGITARGLIDNTALTPVMADFLDLDYPFSSTPPKAEDEEKAATRVEVEAPAAAAGFKIYPNPANNLTNLQFTVPANTGYKVVISDIGGNTIKVLSGGNTSGGFKNLQIDLSSLNNGVYFAKLSLLDGKTKDAVTRLVVQK